MKTNTALAMHPTIPVPTKAAVIAALRAFVSQRSGIDFRDYQSGDWKSSRAAFMGDYRPMLRRGRQARHMLAAIEWRDSITAEAIIAASSRAYSGRLSFRVKEDGAVGVDYCVGQYFVTEYRASACAVLAAALWQYWRENAPAEVRTDGKWADYIRGRARQELGRGIAAEWFN